MMGAAIGVSLAASVAAEPTLALGIVLVAASLLANLLYALRGRTSP
jgi:MFS transporter, DHA1 family, multidrug resistance protein